MESTTDIFSSVLVLLGLKYAKRPADENHPYGHGRIEPLITFLVVAFLVVSATIIAYESIQNINTPHELPEPWTLYVLGGIILWKEISYQVVIRKSRQTNSSSLKADAWHHRSDAITSITAFIGISISLVMGKVMKQPTTGQRSLHRHLSCTTVTIYSDPRWEKLWMNMYTTTWWMK
ncbi:cation diffusion facilitator family transporter [Niabella sp. W65]|nr:cation diffusion facilitator family transporter [Niabella sp. W65]MCH7365360.1 cation diffusion facilitator family transporter [Niabella sp. W65]